MTSRKTGEKDRERLTLSEFERLTRDSWKDELRRVAEVMERLASWPWEQMACQPLPGRRQPAVDMFKEDGRIVVTIELPGVRPEEIEASIEGDVLTIRRRARGENEPEGRGYYLREQHTSSFVRTLRLPSQVEDESADAEMKDGVLTIRLQPKAPSSKKTIPLG